MKNQNRSLMLILLLSVLIANVIYSWGEAEAEIKTNKFKSPLSVGIKLAKESFRVGEAVEGVITIKSTYMSSQPVFFMVRLYKEDKVYSEISTSVKRVPLGTTKFSFKEFGFPYFNSHPGAEGKWKIFIIQQNINDSDVAEAELSIVPPAIRNKEVSEHRFIKNKIKY